jgi:ribose 5-phosphate isomerase B
MTEPLHVSIGCDHAGFALKPALLAYLEHHGIAFIDHGTHSKDSVDYPDLASGKARFGVLICSSGIGMSIAANKISGVRAVLVQNPDNAEYARRHNDANVICLGAKYTSTKDLEIFLDIFFKTDFEGGRHCKRVDKIQTLERT